MTTKTRKKVSDRVWRVLGILFFVIVIWMVISYIDIMSQNTSPNPQYGAWNIVADLIHWATGQ